VDDETLHDLTAAYALDALDGDEERAYEEHLRACARCREELAELSPVAASLAYGAAAAAPPAALRERILSEARAERERVVVLRPRWALPLAGVAAVAAAAAVALAVWAASLNGSRNDLRTALRIVGDPRAERVETPRATVYVTPAGDAALVERLPPARSGRTYQAWVIAGGAPRSAGTFDGRGDVVVLHRRVEAGDVVAVSVEPSGGSSRPTTTPLLQART
jgi:anti-sigma-K factor RskA